MPPWSPVLPAGDAPIYERLVELLRADIASGHLTAGARLPPQRDLAHRLGLGLGTVTRAYVEAEKAGLVEAHVGRGSFVRGGAAARPPSSPDNSLINLAQNIAPCRPAQARLADTLARLRRRGDLTDHLAYAPVAGMEAHRRAGAAWLERSAGLVGADWSRLVVCAGDTIVSVNLAFARPVGQPSPLNRTGFPGGHLVWVKRPRVGPRPDDSSALPLRREARCRSVRAADGD